MKQSEVKKSFYKVLCERFTKSKPSIYFLGGVISLFLLVWFLIKHSIGNNDLTNWIIALANVVMATAAIIGVFFAKKWKQQATTDKVIEFGGDFLVVVLSNLQHVSASAYELNRIKNILSTVKSYELITPQNTIALFEHCRFFLKDSDDYFEAYRGVSTKDQQIRHLGWTISKKYDLKHNVLINSSFDVYDLARLVKYEINMFFNYLGHDFERLSKDVFHGELETVSLSELHNIDGFIEAVDEILKAKHLINDSLQYIRKENPTLFDYFTTN